MLLKCRKVSLWLSLGVLLVGCNIGKKYTRPDLELPQNYRMDSEISPEIGETEDTIAFEKVQWRDIFQDSLLVELIESGLDRNFDIKTALANIEIADRILYEGKFLNHPEIEADIADITQTYRSKNYRSAANSKWYDDRGKEAPDYMYLQIGEVSTGIFASWEIDFWRKYKNQRAADSASFFGTMEARRAVDNRLISSIATAYFNLVQLNAQIDVAKTNAELNDSTLRMIELQYKSGEITKLALQQTEAQRLVALALVPDLEEEIIIQENILQTLTSHFPDSVEISRNLREIIKIDSLIDIGAPVDLLRNRPDVRMAEFDLIAANAEMNIHQALRYPSFSIGGSTGVNALLPQNWFDIPGSLFAGFSAGITAPIFKRRVLRTNYEIAVLEREKAEIHLNKTIYESVAEVSNALVRINKQKERLDYAERRVANAQAAVRNANLLFRSGFATYLEVITAQSNALQSDLDRIEIQHEQYEAIIELYSALGAMW